jgi:hypothetical protein
MKAFIATCTRLIDSKRHRGAELAKLHHTRATVHFFYTYDYDSAVADYDAAIRLNATDKSSIKGRADSYLHKGTSKNSRGSQMPRN